ncbi:putative ATP-dependent helicase [Zalerion maritima]|uniref:ATP-dependent helicase n=1 Tax=Zalerion maritima TaxID=339359 RepID=A0AAD5RWR9_9PEZI|nr:putative ATP-dependent helicase [Zalerion maritima]
MDLTPPVLHYHLLVYHKRQFLPMTHLVPFMKVSTPIVHHPFSSTPPRDLVITRGLHSSLLAVVTFAMEPNSPLPLRGRGTAPQGEASSPSTTPIHQRLQPGASRFPRSDALAEDIDEIPSDEIEVPCSPYITQPTQIIAKAGRTAQPTQPAPPNFPVHQRGTQPTQIIARKPPTGTQATQILPRSKNKFTAHPESLRLSPPSDPVGSSFLQDSPIQPFKVPPKVATQPTQILAGKRSLLVHSTAKTTHFRFTRESESEESEGEIEVPASSPFRTKRSPYFSDQISSPPRPSTKVALAMAPAGTSFRPPRPAASRQASRQAIEISDDELAVGSTMKKFDSESSDGESQAQTKSDIRPSSFVRKATGQSIRSMIKVDGDEQDYKASPTSSQGSDSRLGKRKRSDIYLEEIQSFNDIKHGHARMLAKKVYHQADGGFTAAQCLDALLTANHDVKKAVDLLMNEGESSSSDKDSDVEFVGSQPKRQPISISSGTSMDIHEAVKVVSADEDDEVVVPSKPSRLAARRSQLESLRNKRQQRKGGIAKGSTGSRTSSPEEILSSSRVSHNSTPDPSTFPVPKNQAAWRPKNAPVALSQSAKSSSPGQSSIHTSQPALTSSRPTTNITIPQGHSRSGSDHSASTIRRGRKLIRRLQPPTAPTQPKRLIDIESSDSEEPEAEESEPEQVEDLGDQYEEDTDEMRAREDHVLNYINKSTSVDILAFVNKDEADVKYFLEHQPFSSLVAAEKVTIEREVQKGRKRRMALVPIGSEIVQGIWPSITSMRAASALINQGNKRVELIDEFIKDWNRDRSGRYKPACGIDEPDTDDEGATADTHDNPNETSEKSSAKALTNSNTENGVTNGVGDVNGVMPINSTGIRDGKKIPGFYEDDDEDDSGDDVDNDPIDANYEEDNASTGPDDDWDGDSGDGGSPSRKIRGGGRSDMTLFKRGDIDPITGLKDIPFSTPKFLEGNCTLKRHQKFGLNFLALLRSLNIPALLADDMGLGKTCTVISLVACVAENDGIGVKGNARFPNLIVVPPSTLDNWQKEFARFAPNITVAMYRNDSRAQIADQIRYHPDRYQVVLTSYSQIGNKEAIGPLRAINFNMAVFDEGHQHVKNKRTQEWSRLMSLSTRWKLILSGTPVQNDFEELICILSFLDPKIFTERMFKALEPAFKTKESLLHVGKGTLGAGERPELARSMLAPYLLQRRKETVAMNLPLKTHRIIYCGMTESQAAIHNNVVNPPKKGKKSANPYMRLKQAGSHSIIVRHHFNDDVVNKIADRLEEKVDPYKRHLILRELTANNDFYIQRDICHGYKSLVGKFAFAGNRLLDSGKTQTLLRLLRDFREQGHKTLVFTPFKETAGVLHEAVVSTGMNALYMAGDTAVTDRPRLLRWFERGDEHGVQYDAFVLTTGTGGAGINLTAATKVIIYDMADNPQDDVQAENRAHRMGQRRPVEVIRLITKGSVEETIFAASKKKLEMADKVTNWVGLRDLPVVESEDGKLDDLMDVNNREVQKRFAGMCKPVKATVSYSKSMDGGVGAGGGAGVNGDAMEH